MDKPDGCVLLEVLNIVDSSKSANAYVLILGDPEGHRHLPVVIGAAEAQSIAIELKNVTVPRPMTHDLFIGLMRHTAYSLLYAEIYHEADGVYYSNLQFSDGENSFTLDARTSDAIAIALRAEKPLYIQREIMERNAVDFREKKEGTGLEMEQDDEDELKDKLSEAIQNEEYEQAAELRDKLKHLRS